MCDRSGALLFEVAKESVWAKIQQPDSRVDICYGQKSFQTLLCSYGFVPDVPLEQVATEYACEVCTVSTLLLYPVSASMI